jgi:hypothetical protein
MGMEVAVFPGMEAVSVHLLKQQMALLMLSQLLPVNQL